MLKTRIRTHTDRPPGRCRICGTLSLRLTTSPAGMLNASPYETRCARCGTFYRRAFGGRWEEIVDDEYVEPLPRLPTPKPIVSRRPTIRTLMVVVAIIALDSAAISVVAGWPAWALGLFVGDLLVLHGLAFRFFVLAGRLGRRRSVQRASDTNKVVQTVCLFMIFGIPVVAAVAVAMSG